MIKNFLLAIVAFSFIACSQQENAGQADIPKTKDTTFVVKQMQAPDSLIQKISYALGYELIETNKKYSMDIDVEYYLRGIADYLSNHPGLLNAEQRGMAKTDIQDYIQQKMQEKQNRLKSMTDSMTAVLPELQKGFFENNKKKPGVKVTASGLQYEVIREGNGEAIGDRVFDATLRGTYVNGLEFDNSSNQGGKLVLPPRGLFPGGGWDEAVTLMKFGGKYKFYFPPSLTFKEQGFPSRIAANSILIYEIEPLRPQGGMDGSARQGQMPPPPMPPPGGQKVVIPNPSKR